MNVTGLENELRDFEKAHTSDLHRISILHAKGEKKYKCGIPKVIKTLIISKHITMT
ncbi:hypothetical protein [Metaclostridioides mangenotii]|uniref:hypothetical protein n=1 Tax=Metaclostridioides mangenotii TaxID=1540 RepID=UPI000B041684|nr:hypothetical protein [Clostridioides mangenotii]